jgi:glucan phosphoethanolaminetransferase (alkaline phosphatase superfamily)
MSEFDFLTILPGLLLVVLVILAQSYWTEARDFYNRALNDSLTENERIKNVENYRRASYIVRLTSFGMILCLLSVLIQIFIPRNISTSFVKVTLVIVSLLLVIFLVVIASGRFLLKYLKPNDLLKKIKGG